MVREDAGGFLAGDRVAAMPVVGGFAEMVAVDPEMVFPLPDAVPIDRGAAIPLNYLTADFALHRRARLVEGETVLVHGAAGGLGTAACQLAATHGARVLAVVSSPDKARSRPEGPARRDPAGRRLPGRGPRLTGGRGVDVVVDPVGGDRFPDSLRSLATGAGSSSSGSPDGDSDRQGQPATVHQHHGDRRRLGGVLADPARLRRQAVAGTAAADGVGPSTRRSGRSAPWTTSPRPSAGSTNASRRPAAHPHHGHRITT